MNEADALLAHAAPLLIGTPVACAVLTLAVYLITRHVNRRDAQIRRAVREELEGAR